MAEMRNLLTDPWPNSVDGWRIFKGSSSDMQLRMTLDGEWMFWEMLTAGPAGEYVVAVLALSITNPIVFRVKDGNLAQQASVTCQNGKCMVINFTTGVPNCQLIFDAANVKGSKASLGHFLLCTKQDWTHMRAIKNPDGTPANIRWFAPPKTAATGVMSTPALDRGGALLELAAIIHIGWWQHD